MTTGGFTDLAIFMTPDGSKPSESLVEWHKMRFFIAAVIQDEANSNSIELMVFVDCIINLRHKHFFKVMHQLTDDEIISIDNALRETQARWPNFYWRCSTKEQDCFEHEVWDSNGFLDPEDPKNPFGDLGIHEHEGFELTGMDSFTT